MAHPHGLSHSEFQRYQIIFSCSHVLCSSRLPLSAVTSTPLLSGQLLPSWMLPPPRSLPDFQSCTIHSPVALHVPTTVPSTLPITLNCNCPWTCLSPPLGSRLCKGHDGELVPS